MKDIIPSSDVIIPEDRKVSLLGWDFNFMLVESPVELVNCLILRSFHKLENAESPDLIYSFYCHNLPKEVTGSFLQDCVREGCVWLMSHWWEHKLKVCPCLDGKVDEETNFRKAFMGAILRENPPLTYGRKVVMLYELRGIS